MRKCWGFVNAKERNTLYLYFCCLMVYISMPTSSWVECRNWRKGENGWEKHCPRCCYQGSRWSGKFLVLLLKECEKMSFQHLLSITYYSLKNRYLPKIRSYFGQENIPIEEVFDHLRCTKEGLNSEAVQERLDLFGYNKLEEKKVTSQINFFSPCTVFFPQFLYITFLLTLFTTFDMLLNSLFVP